MTHTINLNHITKIEGHAKLYVEIKDNKIKKCELASVEGSRYFEGILKGKQWYEAGRTPCPLTRRLSIWRNR